MCLILLLVFVIADDESEQYMLDTKSPVGTEVFIIAANLLVRNRSTEAIDLITGYSNLQQSNCTGELVSALYDMCLRVVQDIR